MPQGNSNRKDQRAADRAARQERRIVRAVGSERGETTGGSKFDNWGNRLPIGSSQPPTMGLSRSSISNASFIPDYNPSTRANVNERMQGYVDEGKMHTRVSMRDAAVKRFGNSIPNVERPGSIKAWNGDTVRDMPVQDKPTGRPWGKEGTVQHPDFRASSARGGAIETANAASRVTGRGRRAGLTTQEIRTYTGPYAEVAQGLRSDADKYEREYANKYLGHQTDRMREMTGNKRQPGNFEDVAPSDAHRGGVHATNSMPRSDGDKYAPATKESVARDLGDYATRPLGREFTDAGTTRQPGQHVSEAPPKSIGTQFKMAAPHLGRAAMAGLGTAAVVASSEGARRQGVREMTASNGRASANQQTQRRSDAADMGPVKGRALTQANAWSGGQPKQSGKGHSTGVRVVGK
jgi:hypothetical protein